MNAPNPRRQRGAASIEFALMLMLGLLPLLLFTFSGVMIMVPADAGNRFSRGCAHRCAMAAPMNVVPRRVLRRAARCSGC